MIRDFEFTEPLQVSILSEVRPLDHDDSTPDLTEISSVEHVNRTE